MSVTGGGGAPAGPWSPELLAEFERLGSAADTAAPATSAYPGLVYMGQERDRVDAPPAPGAPSQQQRDDPRYRPPTRLRPGQRDRWLTGEEAVLEYYTWDTKRQRDFLAQAKVGGLLDPQAGIMEGAQVWAALVEQAAFYGAQNERGRAAKMSPWDILSTYMRDAGGSPASPWQRDPSNPDFRLNALTGERQYVGPRWRTQTDSSVNFTDPSTAKALATSVFQQLMQRDPNPGELGAWAEALRQAEQQSPVTRTTTTEHDPVTGEIIGTNTVTDGGLDAAGQQYLAEQQVKGTQEYADTQAGTTYMGALESLVFGSPSLGS